MGFDPVLVFAAVLVIGVTSAFYWSFVKRQEGRHF